MGSLYNLGVYPIQRPAYNTKEPIYLTAQATTKREELMKFLTGQLGWADGAFSMHTLVRLLVLTETLSGLYKWIYAN